MQVAVTAGTPVDTELGKILLEKNYFETISYPVANSPKEQDRLQFLGKEVLENKICEIIDDAKTKGAKALFIYCNSLSTAINYKKIEKYKDFKIITPLEIYKNYAQNYNNLAIIGANSQSVYGIEKVLKGVNNNLNLITIGFLPIVLEIEAKNKPELIVQKLGLKSLFKFFEEVNIASNKIDKIILGCTHFPYVKEEISKYTSLDILDPADDMIKELKNFSSIKNIL